MSLTLTTEHRADHIRVTDRTGACVAKIFRNCEGGYWEVRHNHNVCDWVKGREFQSLQAAEYACLMIAHEGEACGY